MTAALASVSMSGPQPPEEHPWNELTLAAIPSAVSCARLLVHKAFIGEHFTKDFVRSVEQVTDELVVHAVATTGVTVSGSFSAHAFDHLRLLVVRLQIRPRRVVVEVRDDSNEPPHPRLTASRAIRTVERWGYDLPAPGRRVMWCAIAIPPDSRVLPRRVPRSTPRRAGRQVVGSVPDLALLRRVRDGLRELDDTGNEDS